MMQIGKVVSSGFYQLRQMKFVRKSLPIEAAKSKINDFVVLRKDYCNGLLTVQMFSQFGRLQSFKWSSSATVLCAEIFTHYASPSRQALAEMSGESEIQTVCDQL